MNRSVTLLLVAILLGLQFALWIGDKNFFDLKRLENTVQTTDDANSVLDLRNQKLLAEVIDLKQGGETLETLARYELGLIKPNETFYQIVE